MAFLAGHADRARYLTASAKVARRTARRLTGGVESPALHWFAAGLLAACVWVALPATSAVAAEPQPATLYHNYCSVCHGDKGDGRSRAAHALQPVPRDFTSPASRNELSHARIVSAIKYGRPGTAMVAYRTQLSDRDIDRLADYVLATFVRREAGTSTGADTRGRQIYAANCSVCHGDRGQGAAWAGANMARPPRNFAAAGADLTRETMIATVTHGRAGTAMAGFSQRLSPGDIEQVVDFVRTALMPAATATSISGTRAHGGREADAARAPAGVDMMAAFPKGLKGDAKRGSALYLANCATCHGSRGDGQGPRAYFINPKPRNFIEPATRARFNRPLLHTAIAEGRLGAEMPAWDKVFDDQQIADVGEYVFQAFIRTGGTPPQAAK
jgi:mono/diheme cytochrome c family protein